MASCLLLVEVQEHPLVHSQQRRYAQEGILTSCHGCCQRCGWGWGRPMHPEALCLHLASLRMHGSVKEGRDW